MKTTSLIVTGFLLSFGVGYFLPSINAKEKTKQDRIVIKPKEDMKLGAFSISLSVQDLQVSKEFYEKLGFSTFGGSMEQNYLVMKNGETLIGIFQGMFEGNILTFNPGWDQSANDLKQYDDVREIQKTLKDQQIKLTSEADENTKGPASIMLKDPDGNVILIDQHR